MTAVKRHEPLTISAARRPKVLLLGNGLNRVYGGASWEGLLDMINRTEYTRDQVKEIPMPMQAVLLSGDHVESSLKELKQELTKYESHPWLEEQLRKLLSMPFDCILTPNFTYELECAVDPEFLSSPVRHRRYQRHTPAVSRAERQFMLHTYYQLPAPGGSVPVFHIHGEARKPESVILGHFYYGNLLFCYDSYLTKRAPGGTYPSGQPDLTVQSWLDYFILGDVYSIGFGFDTSELDLWWLLCRKKRERADHGALYFFDPEREKTRTRHALLRAYETNCISLGFSEPDNDGFRRFYENAVEEIGRRVSHV